MQIKNVKHWADSGPKAYFFALLGIFLAFCVRYSLHGFLQGSMPMTFFIINTVVIALLYGYKPSLLTVVISVPLASFFFVPPFDSYLLPTAQDAFLFCSYIFIALIAVVIIEWLQRERYRAVLISKVSDSRYRLLAKTSSHLRNMQSKHPEVS